MVYYQKYHSNKSPLIPYEENEQRVLIEWLEIKGLKFSAIPNSTYTTSWKVKNKNKAMGVRAGLPDLLICLPNRLLFIEMKREKGGQISENQKEWIGELNQIDNVEAVVCRGFDEAKNYIENYLNLFKAKNLKTK